jgi:RNA polymerase sigma-54 factor
MALTTRLEFRQSQALVMTPQLMQAIKLLQLSNLDLMAYVEEELEKNPLLERVTDDDGPVAPEVTDAPGSGPEGDGPTEWMGEDLATSRNEIEDSLGTRLDNVFPEDGTSAISSARTDDASAAHSEWASVGSGGREDGEYNLEAFVSAERTLADHLAEQLSLSVTDPARRMIGQHLIDLVDEAGYLSSDI